MPALAPQAQAVLEQFRRLSPKDRRQVADILQQQVARSDSSQATAKWHTPPVPEAQETALLQQAVELTHVLRAERKTHARHRGQ